MSRSTGRQSQIATLIDSAIQQADALKSPAPAAGQPAPAPTPQLTALHSTLASLKALVGGKATDEAAIAKYQELGEWSRHYSTVRLTVVPFGITTALAVLAFGWERSESIGRGETGPGVPLFTVLAVFLWAATILLMIGLTVRTYVFGGRMMRQAEVLGLTAQERSLAARILRDAPLWACLIASIGLGWAAWIQVRTFTGAEPSSRVRVIEAPALVVTPAPAPSPPREQSLKPAPSPSQ